LPGLQTSIILRWVEGHIIKFKSWGVVQWTYWGFSNSLLNRWRLLSTARMCPGWSFQSRY